MKRIGDFVRGLLNVPVERNAFLGDQIRLMKLNCREIIHDSDAS